MADGGVILGRYRVLERIGSDPLGDVLRTRLHGVGGFEKDFAVIRLHRSLCEDPAVIGRLVRAAALAARLHADRLQRVQTIDVENGQYYLVFDLARGIDLAVLGELLRARGEHFPHGAALALALDVIEAVEAAHARTDVQPGGLLHLLLSPHAIMVDGDGESRVLATGLYPALLRPGWVDGFVKLRQPWLAPEVIAGRTVDARADVYSIGALLDEWTDGAPDDAELSRLIKKARALDVEARLPSLLPLKRMLEARLPDRGRARRELAQLVSRWLSAAAAPTDVTRQQVLSPELPLFMSMVAEPGDPLEGSIFTEEQTRPLGPGSPPLELDDTLLGEPLPPTDHRPAPPFALGAPFEERTDVPDMPDLPDATMPDAAVKWAAPPPIVQPPAPPSTHPRSITQALPPLSFRATPPAPPLAAKVAIAAGVVMILAGVVILLAPRSHKAAPLGAANAARAHATPARLPPGFGVGGGGPSAPSLVVSTEPAGARLFVDGIERGTSPLELMLDPGHHHVAALAEGRQLERRDFDLPATDLSLALVLPEAAAPGGPFGLKVHCAASNELRVFVDDVDTGASCTGESRIAVDAGPHRLALYAPRTDELIAVRKQVDVLPREQSTRVYLKY